MPTDGSCEARVAQAMTDLGIPVSHGLGRHMPLYAEAECGFLVPVGMDIHGRGRQVTPHAAVMWTELRAAVHRGGIAVQLVAAFRSLEYQRQIFERKVEAGQSLDDILRVNAPPGYSEHHTSGQTSDSR